ncbi:MAG: hypothetical protein LBG65_01055 [Puniceicoccales bacterium]|nr:hypothetical protein [Puniceicoccales bacterium]
MSLPQKKTDSRKGDDRNLVLVDQDFGQPDFEDRMFLFWVRNKALILGVAGVAIVASVGAIIFKAVARHRLETLQNAYTTAVAAGKPEALLAFSRENAGQPLARVAAIEAGDKYFGEKKYDEAAKAYAIAGGSAGAGAGENVSAVFSGRAALGAAFSELYALRKDAATKAFVAIQNTPAHPAGVRGQALLSLAILAVEADDLAAARKWLDTMDRTLPANDPWLMARASLLEQVPALTVQAQPPAVAAADAGKPVPAVPQAAPPSPAKE